MAAEVVFWRRLDTHGLERLELLRGADGIQAQSTVLCVGEGACRLDHFWRLTPDWSVVSVEIERHDAIGRRRLRLERAGSSWLVDGAARPDLDGAAEPDLSVTPFCNTFPIRRLAGGVGAKLTLDTAYLDGVAMTVTRSRQLYRRLAANRVRYVDLGTSSGFEADVTVDGEGLVLRYEGLFERVEPA